MTEIALRLPRDVWGRLLGRISLSIPPHRQDRATLAALEGSVAAGATLLGVREAQVVVRPGVGTTVAVELGGDVFVPSASSWIRASAAALGRFPRTAEIEGSMAGALLADGVDHDTVLAGITELCVDVLRQVVDERAARRASNEGELASEAGELASEAGELASEEYGERAREEDPLASDRAGRGASSANEGSAGRGPTLALQFAPRDFVELYEVTAPEAMASELARLMWEATGVPLTVRFEVDPGQRAGAVGVVLAGVAECPIPLLPAGAALSRAVSTDEQVLPIAGNAFWQGPAAALAGDPALIDRAWAFALCLFDLCRERAVRLSGQATLDELHRIAERACPQGLAIALERLGRATLDAVLAALIRSAAPICDLRAVFQAITEYIAPVHGGAQVFAFGNAPPTGRESQAVPLLVSQVRRTLGARIVALLTSGDTTLRAHVVSPVWEAAATREPTAALDDQLRAGLRELGAVGFGGTSWRTALVTTAELRAHVTEAVRGEFPHVSVIAFDELPPWVALQVLSISVGAAAQPDLVFADPEGEGSIVVDVGVVEAEELIEDAFAIDGEVAEVESE